MWWKWLIFGIVFVIIPIGLNCLLGTVKSKIINNTQKKHSEIVFTKLCCYYWLADLFYMSFIIKNTICKFIFGGLLLLIILYNLTLAFISNNKKHTLEKWGILQDFVVGVALTIYLIYIIPGKQIILNGEITIDNSLREIVTTILAAIYGGLFTLVGVAWTIRKGDADRNKEILRIEKERKEEERKIHMPYLKLVVGIQPFDVVNSYIKQSLNLDDEKSVALMDKNIFYLININNFIVKNISSHNLLLRGILLDNKFCKFDNQQLLEVNTVCQIQTTKNQWIIFAKPLKQLLICVEDIIGNKYTIECKLNLHMEDLPAKYTTEKGAEYQGFRCKYLINNLALPILIEE